MERFVNHYNMAELIIQGRSVDRDIFSYTHPKADIVVNEEDIKDIKSFINQHKEKNIIVIKHHIESSDFLSEEWLYDIYYAGIYCFPINITDKELELSDEDLSEIIEDQMGYGNSSYDILIFDGERIGKGYGEYPIAKIKKKLRFIPMKGD